MSETRRVLTPIGVVRILCLAAAMGGAATAGTTAQVAPPRQMDVTATGPGTAHVSWRASPARWFKVIRYRAGTDVEEATSGELPGTTMQWDDAGLVAGFDYQYVIQSLYYANPILSPPTLFTMPLEKATLAGDFTARRLGPSPRPYTPPPSQPTTTTPALGLPPSLSSPGPVGPAGFIGFQVSPGTVQLAWHPVTSGYSVQGPNLPADGLTTSDTSLVVSGLPVGTYTFMLGMGNPLLYQGIHVTVR